jgi:hypothetical protein
MPFDRKQLRLERFQAEVGYHAAYLFWNLRGVLAERWAHGPLFGATNETPQQVSLMPIWGETPDQRLQAAYGLRACGVVGEGQEWVTEARGIAADFISDGLEVLRPKRVVRVAVNLFGLYPVPDMIQASRRLRSTFYRSEALEAVLPESERTRSDFHSAIDFIVPDGDSGTNLSVIVGAVGPPHRGSFFAVADPERDDQWWIGLRVERREVVEQGISNPRRALSAMLGRASDDFEHVARTVLTEVVE